MKKILTLEEFRSFNNELEWDCYKAYKDYFSQKIRHIWSPFYQWRDNFITEKELDQEIDKQKSLLSNTDENFRSEVLMLAFRSYDYSDGYRYFGDCVMRYFQIDGEKRYKAVKKFLISFGTFLFQENIEEIKTRIISHFPTSEEDRLNKVIDSISQKAVSISRDNKQVEQAMRLAREIAHLI